MKNDIKKKFIDILFEPEEEDEVYEKPVKAKTNTVIEETVPTMRAKDLLYNKKPESSAFINLDEKPVKYEPETIETDEGNYEFSSQISPIFGVLKESEHKKTTTRETDEKQVNKPENSHLEIITSPIYGYGKRDEDKDSLELFNNYFEDVDEKELHEILDNIDDYTYDDFVEEDNDDSFDDEITLFNYEDDD